MRKLFTLLLFFLAYPAFSATVSVSACTQSSIEAARDAAGAGGTVNFPSCTYVVDGLKASVANQTWVLENGAVIIRSTSTTFPILQIQAPLRLVGGVLDGGRGVNVNPANGIDGTAQSFEWRGGTLQNVSQWGIGIDNAPMTLRDITIKNVVNACVLWRNVASVTMQGPFIDHVLCDRSGEDAGSVSSGGILIHAADGKWSINPHVLNSEVRLPSTSQYAAVGIEVINAQHVTVMASKTIGGRIGVSFGNVDYGIIIGNIVQVPTDYAFEVATASLNVNLQGNNATGYGPSMWGIVASGGSTNIKALGNALAGFTGGLSGGMSGNSNVCWYSGSSYSVNYGNG